MTIVETARAVTGGVDTHLDVHVAAALDNTGGVLGVESFPTTGAGYRQLHEWLCTFGEVSRVGVEGTGAYGAGLARFLHAQDVEVIEVDRPNRQARRRHGKSDPLDSVEAARAALSGKARGRAKTADGQVDSCWWPAAPAVTCASRRSTRSATSASPPPMTCENASTASRLERWPRPPPPSASEIEATPWWLPPSWPCAPWAGGSSISATTAPPSTPCWPSSSPPQLLSSSASMAVASTRRPSSWWPPATIPSASAPRRPGRTCVAWPPCPRRRGKVTRHRLDRGGNRQANHALWRIVFTRAGSDPRTRDYIERRLKEGLSKPEIFRVLKRYVAREVYRYLPRA